VIAKSEPHEIVNGKTMRNIYVESLSCQLQTQHNIANAVSYFFTYLSLRAHTLAKKTVS